MDSLSLIVATLRAQSLAFALDVGCGSGFLARALARHDVETYSLDPSPQAIMEARRLVPGARACVGVAEHLPFADGSIPAAIFLNSLHHVPRMDEALAEAARVVGSGGTIIVVEPLTQGSLFRAFLQIEDETMVREAAQRAVQDAVANGALRLTVSEDYERHDAFTGLDQFLERALAAEPVREANILANRTAIAQSFEAEAEQGPGGRFVLAQPMRAQILTAR